jgi:hypothetical protein
MCNHEGQKATLQWFDKVYENLCYQCLISIHYDQLRKDVENSKKFNLPLPDDYIETESYFFKRTALNIFYGN